MNKKKRAIAFVVVLFALITALIVYIFSELYSESEIKKEPTYNAEALKFKDDYEKLNGEMKGDNKIREISIPKDNPFRYKTAEEIAKMIENKETFVVYFGFNSCPWCRSVLPTLIESAKENNIDEIYYVDVLEIRDKYELNDKHKAVKTVEGTEGYNKLLELLDSVLSDYSPLKYTVGKKTYSVKIKEKRIYAPNIIIVKNGVPLALETGISSEQKDGYQDLTDEMICETKEKFNCLFEKYNTENSSCTISNEIC